LGVKLGGHDADLSVVADRAEVGIEDDFLGGGRRACERHQAEDCQDQNLFQHLSGSSGPRGAGKKERVGALL
jgi:hypothetical protein